MHHPSASAMSTPRTARRNPAERKARGHETTDDDVRRRVDMQNNFCDLFRRHRVTLRNNLLTKKRTAVLSAVQIKRIKPPRHRA